MMQSIIGSFSFLLVYLYFIIPLAPVVYIFSKWRSYRDAAPPDPQLGMKTVLYYFKTLAYHVLLAGAVILFTGGLTGSRGSIKAGVGLLIGAGVIYAAYTLLTGKYTNTREFPLTARIYNAFNVIITGLASMIAFIVTVSMLFDNGFRGIEMPLVGFVVYTIAWFFQVDFYLKRSLLKKIFPPGSGQG